MSKNKHKFYLEIQKAIEKEGGTIKDYCIKHNLNPDTVYAGFKRLKEHQEIEITKISSAPTKKINNPITINLNNMQIELNYHNDEEFIKIMRLLKNV